MVRKNNIMFHCCNCGHQGLALHSHHDDGLVSLLEDDFLALLRFRVDAGDEVLRDHLEMARLNATYTCKETQNQIITQQAFGSNSFC